MTRQQHASKETNTEHIVVNTHQTAQSVVSETRSLISGQQSQIPKRSDGPRLTSSSTMLCTNCTSPIDTECQLTRPPAAGKRQFQLMYAHTHRQSLCADLPVSPLYGIWRAAETDGPISRTAPGGREIRTAASDAVTQDCH